MIGCTFKPLAFNFKKSEDSADVVCEHTDLLLMNIKNRQTNLAKLSKYLYELESQMSLIFATSPDIIVLLDKNAKIIKVSDAVLPILGYCKEELIGRCLWNFIVSTDLDKTKLFISNLQNGKLCNLSGNTPLINQWISKQGKLIKLIWRLSLYNDKESQIVGIASDISTFSNEDNYCIKLLQRAVNLSADGIVITDSHSKTNEILYVNKAFEKMCGYTRQELLGKNGKFLQTEECRNSRACSTLKNYIKLGRGCDILLQNVKKNGDVFYNKLTVSAVKEGTEIINHIWVSKDVTDEIGVKYEWSPNAEKGFYLLNE